MRTVVTYDISNDKSRKKVFDILEGVLTRVQLSVFEGEVPLPELRRAIRKVLSHLDSTSDSVRVYHLCAACSPKIDVYGHGISATDEPVRIL